jgi:hypothetical protein
VVSDENSGVQAKVVQWLTGQSFNNILLVAILLAIGAGGKYCLDVVVPAHIKMIQYGYERIDDAHRAEREETLKVYDRWLDLVAGSKKP